MYASDEESPGMEVTLAIYVKQLFRSSFNLNLIYEPETGVTDGGQIRVFRRF